MSPPTAAPSQGGSAGAAWDSAAEVDGSLAAAGGDDAPPELDALRPTFSSPSKEHQHQQAAQIPSRRRLPISLAPVGVRKGESSDSAPLPSLSSAMSSAQQAARGRARMPPAGGSSDGGGGGGKPAWGGSNASGEEWHQQQQQQYPQQPQYSRQFAELARPRRNLGESVGSPSPPAGGARSSPVPAPSLTDKADVGMRPKIEIDAGPTPTSPAVSSASAAAGGGGDSTSIQIGAGAAAAAAAAARSSSSRAEGGSYYRSRKAYIQNRSLSSGGDAVKIGRGGEEGVPRRVVSRHARRFSSGGEFSNGGVGSEFDRYGGGGDLTSNDATNNRRSSAGGGTSRVQIRGGGIVITSLLSSEDTADISPGGARNGEAGGGGGRLVRSRGGHHDNGANANIATTPGSASSAPPQSSAFGSYQRQESAASSVGGGGGGGGDFIYTALGSGASRASTPGGSEGPPGGRPPLVRKRSLTVAMDDGGPGGPAICPSPRGRRRSVDGVFDTKDGNPDGGGPPGGLLESPSRPPRLMAVGNNGVTPVGSGSGGVGGGCFSPLISYPSPHGDRAAGREYALRSPAHDKLSVTVTGPMMAGTGAGTNTNTAGTATPTTLASNSSPSSASGGPVAVAVAVPVPDPSAAGGSHNHKNKSNSAMEVDWVPNENAHAGGSMLPAPSPVTSAGSISSAPAAANAGAGASAPASGVGRRPPSPYPPSPGREYRRAGGVVPQRGTPHSPSPRGAPPSPAHAPGSAGLRRRGTRRMSGGRSTPRGVRSRSGIGKGVYVGGGGGGSAGAGAGSGEGSGTYESDYDSDLSEMSAYSNYSAMGSLERQLQQDTFFELDETLWRVVTRREVRSGGGARVRVFVFGVFSVFVRTCWPGGGGIVLVDMTEFIPATLRQMLELAGTSGKYTHITCIAFIDVCFSFQATRSTCTYFVWRDGVYCRRIGARPRSVRPPFTHKRVCVLVAVRPAPLVAGEQRGRGRSDRRKGSPLFIRSTS